MKVDGGEGVHHDVVKELEVVPLAPEDDVLREDDMKDGGQAHVDADEDHQGVEVARAPEEGKQHEGEQSGGGWR